VGGIGIKHIKQTNKQNTQQTNKQTNFMQVKFFTVGIDAKNVAYPHFFVLVFRILLNMLYVQAQKSGPGARAR